MIYATEQQVVATAVLVVIVALVALFTGMWWGYRRGAAETEEDQRWEREQAKARRTRPVYRRPPEPGQPSNAEVAWMTQLAHEDQALTIANSSGPHYPGEAAEGLCSPLAAAITTGEIQAITSEMDTWLAEHVYGRKS